MFEMILKSENETELIQLTEVINNLLKDKVECSEVINYNESASYLLDNLLAVMHGDGGHYTGDHGRLKSAKDATSSYYELLTEVGR